MSKGVAHLLLLLVLFTVLAAMSYVAERGGAKHERLFNNNGEAKLHGDFK